MLLSQTLLCNTISAVRLFTTIIRRMENCRYTSKSSSASHIMWPTKTTMKK